MRAMMCGIYLVLAIEVTLPFYLFLGLFSFFLLVGWLGDLGGFFYNISYMKWI